MKELYRSHSEQESSIPIFSKGWWLDAVCGADNWDVCVVERNGKIVASMPYFKKNYKGFTVLDQPPLTQSLGPWIMGSNGKYAKTLSKEKELMGLLIDQLPNFDGFKQNWHYSRLNWLPFYWRGFNQTTRYSYVIDGLGDLDKVFAEFSSSYRNKIRKADKLVTIERSMEPERFYQLNKMTFERQNLKMPYSYEFFKRQDSALFSHKAKEIFYAVDSSGAVHSALYLIWDEMSSYVHLVGEDPALRNSGAGIRLIWEAIQYTRDELGLNSFDFEGSMIEGVEQVRRDCGARQKPYFSISKTPSYLLKTGFYLKEMLRAKRS